MPVGRTGAVFIGKTTTPESGHRIVTRSDIHGVTRNPYALDRTPGGSSGGAAAALALGMGALAARDRSVFPPPFAISLGFKPSFGRAPSAPPSFFMPHSVTGPMARTAEDLTLMTEAMARPEPRDPFAWPIPFNAAAARSDRVQGLRIAVSPQLGTDRAPDLLSPRRWTALWLASAGATVTKADPVWPIDPYDPFMVFWDATYAGLLDMYPPDVAAKMAPLLQDIAARGRKIDTLAYHKAMADRLAITAAAAHAFLTEYDAVLAPITLTGPFDVEAEAPAGEVPDDWRWCPYTYVFNMTGQPAVAAPVGFDADGLPIGVQIAGRVGSEEMLLACAAAIDESQPQRRIFAL